MKLWAYGQFHTSPYVTLHIPDADAEAASVLFDGGAHVKKLQRAIYDENVSSSSLSIPRIFTIGPQGISERSTLQSGADAVGLHRKIFPLPGLNARLVNWQTGITLAMALAT